MKITTSTQALLRGATAAALASTLVFGFTGCKSNTAAPIVNTANGQDPADANLAPYTGGNSGDYNTAQGSTNTAQRSTQVLGQSASYQPQSSGEAYYDQSGQAPIVREYPQGSAPPQDAYTDAEEAGETALVETDQAPPPLPEYDQPPAPEPNYMWTPGYWNYASSGTGYYWVPGAWVAPPFYGGLWTPPWWGSCGGRYCFHRGYWGHHIGYYGGINYGFGYIGYGYSGGYWHDRDFVYNRAVTNINPNVIRTYYTRPVVYNGRQYGPRPTDRVSYNGGRGGLNIQPRPAELAALREPHYAPVAAQRELRMSAASNRAQSFRADGGRPAMAFASHPVGNRNAIAEAPREQPINHPAALAPGARPGMVAPGARPGMPAGAQPGVAGNRGPEPGNRGVENARPEPGRPTPSANYVPSGRPNPQPGHPEQGQPQPGRPETGARPAFNTGHENNAPAARPAPPPGHQQPGPNENHNAATPHEALPQNHSSYARPSQPNAVHPVPVQRPGFEPNHPGPVNRPDPAARPQPTVQPHPEPAPRPQASFQPHQEAAPRPQPAVQPRQEAPRPAPAPAARPASTPTPHAAPAPAPHEGGEHGNNDHHH